MIWKELNFSYLITRKAMSLVPITGLYRVGDQRTPASPEDGHSDWLHHPGVWSALFLPSARFVRRISTLLGGWYVFYHL